MPGTWDYPSWEPEPLQLPVEKPEERGTTHETDEDAEQDRPSRVIVIELA
jgi:hypothetical protein